MRFFRQLELQNLVTLEAVKGFLLVFSLVVTPMVFSARALAEFPKPSELNKNTDPVVLRKYLKGINGLLKAKGPDPEVYSTKGQLLEWLKDYSEAVKAYSKAIEMKPTNASYYLFRARSLRKQKKHSQAEKDYSKSIALGERSSEVFHGRALSRLLLKKYQGSIRDAKKAIKIDPKCRLAWFAKGSSELCLGRNLASIKSISKAIELKPSEADYYVVRSNAYRNQGDLKKAKADRELYLKYLKKM